MMETHTQDITGRIIRVGDRVIHDFKGEESPFFVVFERNAIRKKYDEWDESITKPLLEWGNEAKEMRLKIVRR